MALPELLRDAGYQTLMSGSGIWATRSTGPRGRGDSTAPSRCCRPAPATTAPAGWRALSVPTTFTEDDQFVTVGRTLSSDAYTDTLLRYLDERSQGTSDRPSSPTRPSRRRTGRCMRRGKPSLLPRPLRRRTRRPTRGTAGGTDRLGLCAPTWSHPVVADGARNGRR